MGMCVENATPGTEGLKTLRSTTEEVSNPPQQNNLHRTLLYKVEPCNSGQSKLAIVVLM